TPLVVLDQCSGGRRRGHCRASRQRHPAPAPRRQPPTFPSRGCCRPPIPGAASGKCRCLLWPLSIILVGVTRLVIVCPSSLGNRAEFWDIWRSRKEAEIPISWTRGH